MSRSCDKCSPLFTILLPLFINKQKPNNNLLSLGTEDSGTREAWENPQVHGNETSLKLVMREDLVTGEMMTGEVMTGEMMTGEMMHVSCHREEV